MSRAVRPALDESILLAVEKPERYIGQEVNAVCKDADAIPLRFVFAFPDVYEIGMSHLGMQILYDMFNRREDCFCERVFSPWPDLHKILLEQKIPLFSLESQRPVREADFLGFTLQYEMCYTNVLQILDLSGIPLLAAERTEDDPIVIGGGPCSYNPEPVAAFFDLFYIGEGEVQYDALFDLYLAHKARGLEREAFLLDCAKIEGIYVPSLYEASYHADGTLAAFSPCDSELPSVIKRQVVRELDCAPYPEKPVVPYLQATQDRVVLEVMRGCIRGCRFCQAGMIYRPLREKSCKELFARAKEMIRGTGYDELSLSSLSTSDYSQLNALLTSLMDFCPQEGVNISLPSLRIDAFSLDVMAKVQDIKKSSLTFAPEAGTQRLRDVINKGLTEEEIISGASEAFCGGWNRVKLYFMMGLPFETKEDIEGIPVLCQRIADAYYEIPKEERQGKCQISASCSFFVPKPFTPFQWAAMDRMEDFLEKAKLAKEAVRAQKNARSLRLSYHAAPVSVLEGVLARGDRRLSDVILRAYKNGALFDAWTEHFHKEFWDEAFSHFGIDPAFYAHRARDIDELLPWDFIDIGVTKQFLAREWEKAAQAVVTPNCRESCSGCGAAVYGGRLCHARADQVR